MSLIVKNTFIIILVFIITIITRFELRPESIEEINKRAEKYYEKKDFNKAISEWLSILEIDPKNEEIQKKIDSVYDEKYKKDISLQIAKKQLRLAKESLNSDLKDSNEEYDIAWEKFVAAYRIDPNDPELQILKEDMREFKDILDVENRKERLSQAMKETYMAILPLAREKMKLQEYEEALKYWNQLLEIVPMDVIAKEGKRQAELAIQNRLKYERILALLTSGINLFNEKKYSEAELEFRQALRLDSANKEVKSYLEEIDEILEEKRNYELIRRQAEQLYTSGIDNLRKKNFDQAEEDFESTLSLIDNYKDAAERLRSIDRLKEEYKEEQRVSRLRKIDKEFQAGLLALSEGKYKDAIVALEAVLLVDPDNNLAKKYIQTAKEAQEQLEEEIVTEDSPYYSLINSLIVSGKLLYEKGEFSESIRRWEKILDLFPKNRIATEYLLKCNLKTDPEAFDDFSKNYISEGRNLLKEKRYREALLRFEMIKSISENYPGIDGLIASARSGLVKKSAPVAGVSQADIDSRISSGEEYYRKGGEENLKLALQQFQWVTSKDPENVRALIYINRIDSILRVGTTEKPQTAKKLTERQKKLVTTYYFRGINYYAENNFDKAINEWRKVLYIDPDHEKAKNAIMKCLTLIK